jgi:DNA-binding transcriptional LysR family regulator
VACRLVREGLGVAIVDEFSALSEPANTLVVRPFSPRLPITLCALLPKDRPRQRLTQSFVMQAREVVNAHRAATAVRHRTSETS